VPLGIEELKGWLVDNVVQQQQQQQQQQAQQQATQQQLPCLFAIDHCFAIKGQGTVMTGTVLQVRVLACARVRVTGQA
jgi:selenocysteine-specific elongation factor